MDTQRKGWVVFKKTTPHTISPGLIQVQRITMSCLKTLSYSCPHMLQYQKTTRGDHLSLQLIYYSQEDSCLWSC